MVTYEVTVYTGNIFAGGMFGNTYKKFLKCTDDIPTEALYHI